MNCYAMISPRMPFSKLWHLEFQEMAGACGMCHEDFRIMNGVIQNAHVHEKKKVYAFVQ
jgi:hypothetical protein